jgi:nucleoid-associated protein YgaU
MKKVLITAVLLLGVVAGLQVAAQTVAAQAAPAAQSAGALTTDPAVPQAVRNNRFYRESLRLTALAHQAFDDGDYDGSTDYANQALEQARLSDQYVATQLAIKAANDSITAAKTRMDWAVSVQAPTRFPRQYENGQLAYNAALEQRKAENWADAKTEADKVIGYLADVTAPDPNNMKPLPAEYTIRVWPISKDCFWNIAERPWVYGDPLKWQVLYNANKARLPDPNNPDWIDPDFVMVIPSLRGEKRSGMWEEGATYPDYP